MWIVRDKDGTLKLCFEMPVRRKMWEDVDCTIEKLYWGLEHNPEINISNRSNYPEHQIIKLPKSVDHFPEITWETEPVSVDIFQSELLQSYFKSFDISKPDEDFWFA